MYSNIILNRFQNLKNVGKIQNCSISSEVEKNNSIVRIYLNIENNIIQLAKFKCYGNILTTVSADILCDMLINKNIEDITNIGVGELLNKVGEIENISVLEFVISILHNLQADYYKKLEKEEKAKKKIS